MKKIILATLISLCLAYSQPVLASSAVSTATSGNATASAQANELSVSSSSQAGQVDADSAKTAGGNTSAQASNDTTALSSTSQNNRTLKIKSIAKPIQKATPANQTQVPIAQASPQPQAQPAPASIITDNQTRVAYEALKVSADQLQTKQNNLDSKIQATHNILLWVIILLGLILLLQLALLIIILRNRSDNNIVQLS